MEPLSLTFPFFFFLFFFSYGSLLIVFLKGGSFLPLSYLPHVISLIFFSFTHLFLLISLRHINLFIIDPWVPILQFLCFLFFTWVHFWIQQSSNQYKKKISINKNTQVGSIIPGIYNNFYNKNSRVFLGRYNSPPLKKIFVLQITLVEQLRILLPHRFLTFPSGLFSPMVSPQHLD